MLECACATHREVSVTESEMDSSRCFRKKAAQCRRLASDILREHEPVRRVLLEMAAELEGGRLRLRPMPKPSHPGNLSSRINSLE
jgi:hypothetical protein